jgi:outer membrane protein OmpA-like peptidoglycan-associated protein
MTEETASTPEDPRKPQGDWPALVFIFGLIAVGLVTCSQPFNAVTGVTPLPAAKPASTAAAPSAPTATSPAAAPSAAAPAVKAPAPTPGDISERAKTIVASLGQTPSAQACEKGLTRLVRNEPISFRRNSAALGDRAKTRLNGLAAIAGVCGAYKIEIGGHTDRSGGRAFNQKLSEERAAAVQEYLAAQGAPAAALSSKGYGESRPLKGYAPARSRRISFDVTE